MRLFTVNVYERGAQHLSGDRSERIFLYAGSTEEAQEKADWMLGYGHGMPRTYSLEETDRYDLSELSGTAKEAL